MGIYLILFLSLVRKKKYQKERTRSESSVLLRYCHAQPVLELATLRQSPLTCACQHLRLRTSAYARELRCGSGCALLHPALSPAWSPGLTVGALSEGSVFSVKKGRLFERSEFLPFS